MKSGSSWIKLGLVFAVGTVSVAFAVRTCAQVQTTTTTSHGPANKEVQVEKGEVVLVDGNDLIVKMDDGTIRHIPNVPESARITVDGKSLGIHDLKPGMKLQRTIITTTTPRTVTTVQTVTGKVWNVMPPHSVTLTMENGKNQKFSVPDGQKFNVNGNMVDVFALKKGMTLTATKIVETPETVVSQHKAISGTMPPPPQPPPADAPILVVVAVPVAAPAASETASAAPPAKLPKTASPLPLVGLLGLLSLSASFVVKLLRANGSF